MKTTTGLLIFLGVAWGEHNNDGRPNRFLPQACEQNGPSISDYRNDGEGTLTLVDAVLEHDKLDASQGAWGDYSCGDLDLFGACACRPGDRCSGRNSGHVHFGPGNATNSDLVRTEWPSGILQDLQNVASDQFHTVTEPGGEPQLASTRVNGQVQLTLTGKPGSRYDIQTSTDLSNWTRLLNVTVTDPSGTVTFPAPGATGDARRFYRATLR